MVRPQTSETSVTQWTSPRSRVARYYVLAARLRHKNYTRQQQHGGRGATQARSQYTVQGILTRPYLYSGGHCKGERSSRAGAGAASPASRPHLAPSCGGCYSPATALLQPCYSPAAAAAAACAPSFGAPRMRPVVRVRVEVRVRARARARARAGARARARAGARARGRGSDLWSRFGSGSGSGLGLGFGFGFGIGFGWGLATYGLRGLRAAVLRVVAGYHPLSPILACVRGRDRYTGEGRPRGAISGGPCPLVIIPYARSQHERRGPGGALGSAGRICGGRPHRCGRGGAALFQPAHLELPQLRVWAPVPPHYARAWLGVGVG